MNLCSWGPFRGRRPAPPDFFPGYSSVCPSGKERSSRRLFTALLVLGGIALFVTGCFKEQCFPLREGEVPRLRDLAADSNGQAASTRQWLVDAHQQLKHLLPHPRRPVMLTDDMLDAVGRPRDIYAFFDRKKEKMGGLISNFWSLQHTAQAIEHGEFVEIAPSVWPGFEPVWIPVADGVELHGFLGLARDDAGRVVEADCIILLPGFFGDNGAYRSVYMSRALVESGFHVFSIEPRGHGQTEARYPLATYTYGVLDAQDLITVSEWLQDRHGQIRRTGLVGFSWSANVALLAAWFDGRSPDDSGVSERLSRILRPPGNRRHFGAGVIAFSMVPRWEEFLDVMDTPRSVWVEPCPALFQEATLGHMVRKGYPEPSGNLRRAIDHDFAASPLGPSFPVRTEAYRFLRLLPYRGEPAGDKLNSIRVPVLIIHSVNDPLQTAQHIAELLATTRNHNVAAVMLPGGGHIAIQAYARKYFYGLLLNFFDPAHGAAAGAGLVRR